MLSELAFEDATALAALVRSGQVQARELVQATIQRIEVLNPQLNAVITQMFESALAQAAHIDRSAPFAGIPFLVKDLIASCEGARQTEGSRFLSENIAASDSELVRRLRATGLIILAKTNTSELGSTPVTENQLFGPTRNPWNLNLSSGGSSGGSAAAVAAGIVAMAHGNDSGGSLRNPASCCGLFGFKPSRGRMPLEPEHGDLLHRLLAEHALTRSVRDSAALLDATNGAFSGDPYRAPLPSSSFLAAVDSAPRRRLRIAVSTHTPTGELPHPECVEATLRAAQLCEGLGHDVSERRPDLDGHALVGAWFEIWAQTIAGMVNKLAAMSGRAPNPGDFETLTWRWYERGMDRPASDYLQALDTLEIAAQAIAGLLERYDIWLTPTLGIPALTVGAFDTSDSAAQSKASEQDISKYTSFSPYTRLANISGFPAMSVPLHQTPEGVPVGVHFMGKLWDEKTLFSLAGELERASPWQQRRPPISCVNEPH